MKWPDAEEPVAATSACFRMVTDADGNLVPCPRPSTVSGWVRQNNVWEYVEACPGHGLGLLGSAG